MGFSGFFCALFLHLAVFQLFWASLCSSTRFPIQQANESGQQGKVVHNCNLLGRFILLCEQEGNRWQEEQDHE